MKVLWAVTVAALCVLVAEACADTVYMKNGDTVWGREVTEEGEAVIVVRPSGTLRFPKRDVSRIERERMSIPQHYDPPTTGGAARDEGQIPARPAAPAAVPTPRATETPAPAQAPATTPTPAQAPPVVAGPSRPTPTVLPPPSPPAPDRPR